MLKKLKNLQHLALSDDTPAGKCTVQVITQECKNLRILELAGDFDDVPKEYIYKLTHLTKLRQLRLIDKDEVNNTFLRHLVHRCRKLKCLELSGNCWHLSRKFLDAQVCVRAHMCAPFTSKF